MIRTVEDTSLYIAINGRESELDNSAKDKINSIFLKTFDDLAENISNVKGDYDIELVYEIKIPIMKNEVIMEEYFENLKSIFNELIDYNPYFTQLEKRDI